MNADYGRGFAAGAEAMRELCAEVADKAAKQAVRKGNSPFYAEHCLLVISGLAIPPCETTKRYIAKYNGVAWACHDTEADWNRSVHASREEAEASADFLNALVATEDK